MDAVLHLFTWYPLFGVPAGIAWGAVVVAGGRNFDLQFGDKALLVVPWVALYFASLAWPNDKTIANLIEVTLVAGSVPLAMLARVVIGRRVADQARLAQALALGVGALAVVIWLLVPSVPFDPPQPLPR